MDLIIIALIWLISNFVYIVFGTVAVACFVAVWYCTGAENGDFD